MPWGPTTFVDMKDFSYDKKTKFMHMTVSTELQQEAKVCVSSHDNALAIVSFVSSECLFDGLDDTPCKISACTLLVCVTSAPQCEIFNCTLLVCQNSSGRVMPPISLLATCLPTERPTGAVPVYVTRKGPWCGHAAAAAQRGTWLIPKLDINPYLSWASNTTLSRLFSHKVLMFSHKVLMFSTCCDNSLSHIAHHQCNSYDITSEQPWNSICCRRQSPRQMFPHLRHWSRSRQQCWVHGCSCRVLWRTSWGHRMRLGCFALRAWRERCNSGTIARAGFEFSCCRSCMACTMRLRKGQLPRRRGLHLNCEGLLTAVWTRRLYLIIRTQRKSK